MYNINKIPYAILLLFTLIFNLIIGFIGWRSGPYMPFTLFYLIPILFLVYHKKTTSTVLIVNSVLITLLWIIIYIQINPWMYCLINSILRLSIFLFVSIVLHLLIKQRAKLKEQNDELIRINLEKNTLLGMAAHDIKNGLNSIFSFSELLIENKKLKSEFEQEYDFIQMIFKSSKTLIMLLTDILDISKIESGIVVLHPLKNEYISFITERIKLIQVIAQKKEITIQTDFKINSVFIDFDPVYLQEPIDNLLSNAIKYSFPKNEIKIIVFQKENTLITEVCDYGVGIPEKEIHKLFKPFTKISSMPTSGETSSGLGLAIAKKIIELHNGTIGVRSIEGKGSTFFYTLNF